VHEINNPMQAIKGGAMLALEEADVPQGVANYLNIIQSESDRILELTAFLRNLYVEKESGLKLINLEALVDRSLRIMKDDMNRKGLQLDFIRPPITALIMAGENDLQLAFLDLWLNINVTLHQLGRRAYSLSIIVSQTTTTLKFTFDAIVRIHHRSDDEKVSTAPNNIDVTFAEDVIIPQDGKIFLETTAEKSDLFITFPSAADPMQ